MGFCAGKGWGYYGPAIVSHATRRPESGPPRVETFEFDGTDNSLRLEWEQFVALVRSNNNHATNAEDALATMRVVEALYDSAHSGQVMKI